MAARRLALLLVFAVAAPGPLLGQSATARDRIRDAGGHPFRTPAGSPLEPAHRLSLLRAGGEGDDQTLASADVGARLPFWIRRDPRGPRELSVSVRGGVFSRFDLGGPDQALVEVHYRLGALLRARLGALAARLEAYHVSSHLGDEYLLRSGRAPISTSREGVELLVQGVPLPSLLPALTLYGGPGLLLRSARGLRRASLRGGADWESSSGARARFFASVDLFGWAETDWQPALAAEAGVAFGRGARLGLLFGSGPSRAEQFFRESEQLVGVTVSYVR